MHATCALHGSAGDTLAAIPEYRVRKCVHFQTMRIRIAQHAVQNAIEILEFDGVEVDELGAPEA